MQANQNVKGRSEDQDELLLDLTQLALDIVGIFEPTPFADTANAAISAGRGDFLGAALSLVSIVPYVGDLAKVGKLPKYLAVVRRAVERAAREPAFAARAMPLLRKVADTLASAPLDVLPTTARAELEAILNTIKKVVSGAGALKATSKTGLATAVAKLNALPANIRSMVVTALQLPVIKNPRKLAKHPGPITQAALEQELKGKGFVLVKKGTPGMAGRGENSDVFLRRVVDESGKPMFEAVRVDVRLPNPALQTGPIRRVNAQHTPAQRQADSKLRRQVHPLLADPTTPAPKTLTGQLNDGWTFKGDYTHWHHEAFSATDDNLIGYLTKAPVTGLKKFDSMGFEVLRAP